MAQKEGINTPLVVTLAAISAAFLIVTLFSVEAWFNYEVQTTRNEMFVQMGDTRAIDTRVRQEKSLRETQAGDKPVIPITDAMRMIVQSKGAVPWKTN